MPVVDSTRAENELKPFISDVRTYIDTKSAPARWKIGSVD